MAYKDGAYKDGTYKDIGDYGVIGNLLTVALVGIDGRFRLMYWMLGFNLTLTLFSLSLTAGILFKLMAG